MTTKLREGMSMANDNKNINEILPETPPSNRQIMTRRSAAYDQRRRCVASPPLCVRSDADGASLFLPLSRKIDMSVPFNWCRTVARSAGTSGKRMALDCARGVYEAVDRRMPEAAALANWLRQRTTTHLAGHGVGASQRRIGARSGQH
jgi:hypothetical protein